MPRASRQLRSSVRLAVRSNYRGRHQLLLLGTAMQPYEKIVNEPLDEVLNGGYEYVFSLNRLQIRYHLDGVPCLVGLSTAPGTE